MRRQTTLFEDAIDVPIWLDADRERPLAERTHRDRDIGKRLGELRDSTRVRAWWQRVDPGSADLPGRGLEHLRQWLNVVVALLGLVAGAGLALAAYQYDGRYPVNVVRVLGLLIAPQVILLAFNLALLPGRLPVLGRLQDALAAINPGALVASLYRQLGRRPAPAVFAWSSARSAAARRFAKWQMIVWSQIAAVGFNVAAIATAAALIAFTDLAFGWTTTLAIDTADASRLFTAIAWPWEALVPSAAPDAALVERSQFFRLEAGRDALGADPRVLTAWWSFTMLALIVYGLIPRMLFLGLAAWRLRVATHVLLLDSPAVTALRDRLMSPEIETRGAAPAATPASAPAPSSGPARPALDRCADAVIWGQCLDREVAAQLARTRLALQLERIVEAGGGSLEDDRVALAALGETQTVLVLTPAWEPPLLEFSDFLGALRARLGAAASIVVVPIGENGMPAGELELETWTRAVRKSPDPRVYVEGMRA